MKACNYVHIKLKLSKEKRMVPTECRFGKYKTVDTSGFS